MKNKNNSNKLLAMSLSVVLALVLVTMTIIFLSNKVNSEEDSTGNNYFTLSIMKHNESMDKLKQQQIQENRKKEVARVIVERKKRVELAKKKEQERLAKIARLEKERQAERERLNKIAIAKAEKERKEKLAREQTKNKVALTNNNNKKTVVSRGSNYQSNFEATFFTAKCAGCTGQSASGKWINQSIYYQGMRIVAAPPRIPFYTKLRITFANGSSMNAIVLDRGGDIQANRLDILVGSKEEAYRLGRQQVKVEILK